MRSPMSPKRVQAGGKEGGRGGGGELRKRGVCMKGYGRFAEEVWRGVW